MRICENEIKVHQTHPKLLWMASFLLLLTCNHPTVVDRKGLITLKNSPPASAPALPWENILGEWEVVTVEGKALSDIPEEEIPFRRLSIDRYGRIRLDTFQTEYEVLEEKDGSVTLSYSTIGRESFLTIRITEENNAEILETYRDPATNTQSECRLIARRML